MRPAWSGKDVQCQFYRVIAEQRIGIAKMKAFTGIGDIARYQVTLCAASDWPSFLGLLNAVVLDNLV